MTYQPEYAVTRETWCPLTRDNWISKPENALKVPDSSIPLHIQLERELLHENRFTLVLNSQWFIDYPGIVNVSIPEGTPGVYSDPVWKIVLPSAGHRPYNRRKIILHNCADVKIRYSSVDRDGLQATTIFVDMSSNSTFTVNDHLDEAKKRCNADILTPTGNETSSGGTVLHSSTIHRPIGSGSSPMPPATIFVMPLFVSLSYLVTKQTDR